MTRRVVATTMLFVVAGVVHEWAGPVANSAAKQDPCPATIVSPRAPPPGSKGLIAAQWFGHRGLWVDLQPSGVAAYPNARTVTNGWIETKAIWWRGGPAVGRLHVTGRRLSTGVGVMRAIVSTGSGRRGLQPSGLLFSKPGCWRVTGRSGATTLTYVLVVRKP